MSNGIPKSYRASFSLFSRFKNLAWLSLLLGLLCPATLAIAATNTALPNLGSPARAVFSQADEHKLGKQFMHQIQTQNYLLTDPLIGDFVDQMGARLLRHSQLNSHRFHFFVVIDNSVNAFAGPGGYIGINTGTLLTAQHPDEVAAVLAHEIAHVLQNHIARGMEASEQAMLPVLGALIAGAVMGGQAGQGLAAAGLAGAMEHSISFTRSNEEEADRVGMQLLQRAGYNPRSMPAFFQRLASEERFYDLPPAFLRTHPVSQERIADSLNRIAASTSKHYHADPIFAFVQARLRVDTSNDPLQVANTFKTLLRHSPKQPAYRYGYALALKQQGHYKQALRLLEQLKPSNVFIAYSHANTALALHRTTVALTQLTTALKQHPHDYALQQLYARALQVAGKHQQAVNHFKVLIASHPLKPSLYWQLADSQAKQKNLAQAYYNQARGVIMAGNPKTGKQLLLTALKQKPLPATTRAAIYLLLKKLRPLLSKANDDLFKTSAFVTSTYLPSRRAKFGYSVPPQHLPLIQSATPGEI